MAAKFCAECGAPIPNGMDACAVCGHRTAPAAPVIVQQVAAQKRTSPITWIIAVIFLLLIASYLSRATDPMNAGIPNTEGPGRPTTDEQLLHAYAVNQIAADSTYKGTVILLTGRVKQIATDIVDNPYVLIGDEDRPVSIQAVFSVREKGRLAALHREDRVTARCRVAGKILFSIVLNDCELK